jgi:NSS family neurotransmitter:Na+ symporter
MAKKVGAEKSVRGHWGSRLAFILAAAGSAIGLGNIWRFPYVAYNNGGGKFVLLNLFFILTVGLPVMIAEILIGRHTEKGAIGSFEKLSGKESGWRLIGFLGVAAAFIIMAYYVVVAGWVLYYTWLAAGGKLLNCTQESLGTTFSTLLADPALVLLCSTLFLLACSAIVLGGVEKGIEKYSKILMPTLLFILAFLLVNSAFLPNDAFARAIKFVFVPDSNLSGSSVLEALGMAFFSLSLGMGAMLTYGSYLKKDCDLISSAFWVAFLDTAIAFSAFLIIMSIMLAYDSQIVSGPGLVFLSMPLQFDKIPLGQLLSVFFFLLLLFAALTSAISLIEVPTAYLIDKGMDREKACIFVTAGIWFFSIPCAISSPAFDFMDDVASNWMLPFGGLLIAIYVGYVFNRAKRRSEFLSGLKWPGTLYKIWLNILRFVAPALIILVILNKIGVISNNAIDRSFNTIFGQEQRMENAETNPAAQPDILPQKQPDS